MIGDMELWIARDEDRELFVFYNTKPIRNHSFFTNNSPNWEKLPSDLFPEVTWENSPKKVRIELVEE